MATDVFNNPSNDYVYPALSPCAGAGDDSYLQFVKDGIGVVSGSDILAKIDFSSIKIPVSAYTVESKIIGQGEVIYVPGLTKGLQKRQLGFLFPELDSDDEDLNTYFFEVDLSIGYNSSFRYYTKNIDVSANYSQNLTIVDALNIALGNLGVKVTASYDASALIFTGTVDGYDFSISNVILGIIDASENSSSPFPYQANADFYTLEASDDYDIPYANYRNGAVQGIIMKGIYPSETPETPYDKWLYINHVRNYVTIYDPIEIDNFITNIRESVTITFDPSVIFGPFLNTLSISVPDFSCVSTGIIYDPSINYIIPQGTDIDGSIIYNALIEDCSIKNSEVYYSDILNFKTTSNSILLDSSVYGSDIYDGTFFSHSEVIGSFISDSSLSYLDVSTSFIQSSWIRNSFISDSSIACVNILWNSYLAGADICYSTLSNDIIYGSNLNRVILTDSSILSGISKAVDSSFNNVYISETEIRNSDISTCEIHNSFIEDSEIYNGSLYDSSILKTIINDNTSISNSIFQNGWTNAYQLWIDSSNYIWVIDDPTLPLSDPSARIQIQESTILDVSLNNVYAEDSSIYTSYVRDSSLVNCTLYNVTVDPSTTTLINCRIVQINMTQDCSVIWDVDSSTFYTKTIKTIDVGMNGCSTPYIMSAGDYLDWVTTNDYWNKFGDMYIWTSAPDGCPDCHNLINGFYVYNAHTFDCKIEYMLFI